jgi:hypothetical protein
MPRQKNFKRLVRGRMAKTGESYTTARSRFEPPAPGAPAVAADPDAAALARALNAMGLPLTEELLFGVGGGIGFQYLVFEYPGITTVSVDGRFNGLYFEKKNFVETACTRLGLPVRVRPTADRDAADRYLRQALATAPEVAVTLALGAPMVPRLVTVSSAGSGSDLTVLGLPRGRVTMGWDEVLDARWTHARKYGGLYVFTPPDRMPDEGSAVVRAIDRTAACLLEPGRGTNFDGSFGVPGIRKWSRLLTDSRDRKGWPKVFADPGSLREALDSVVRGLSPGAASRRPYAAFLDQAAAQLDKPGLAAVADGYRRLADRWAGVVQLAKRPDATPAELAGALPDLADEEDHIASALRAEVAR